MLLFDLLWFDLCSSYVWLTLCRFTCATCTCVFLFAILDYRGFKEFVRRWALVRLLYAKVLAPQASTYLCFIEVEQNKFSFCNWNQRAKQKRSIR